jgi:hypothetical protein
VNLLPSVIVCNRFVIHDTIAGEKAATVGQLKNTVIRKTLLLENTLIGPVEKHCY